MFLWTKKILASNLTKKKNLLTWVKVALNHNHLAAHDKRHNSAFVRQLTLASGQFGNMIFWREPYGFVTAPMLFFECHLHGKIINNTVFIVMLEIPQNICITCLPLKIIKIRKFVKLIISLTIFCIKKNNIFLRLK